MTITETDPYLFLALILLVAVTVGLARVLLERDMVECLLVLQLLGTTAVAVVLLLSFALDAPGLLDLAMVLALLAALFAVAFVRLGSGAEQRGAREDG